METIADESNKRKRKKNQKIDAHFNTNEEDWNEVLMNSKPKKPNRFEALQEESD